MVMVVAAAVVARGVPSEIRFSRYRCCPSRPLHPAIFLCRLCQRFPLHHLANCCRTMRWHGPLYRLHQSWNLYVHPLLLFYLLRLPRLMLLLLLTLPLHLRRLARYTWITRLVWYHINMLSVLLYVEYYLFAPDLMIGLTHSTICCGMCRALTVLTMISRTGHNLTLWTTRYGIVSLPKCPLWNTSPALRVHLVVRTASFTYCRGRLLLGTWPDPADMDVRTYRPDLKSTCVSTHSYLLGSLKF